MKIETIRHGLVAVLLGGESAEREVSLKSGATVAQALETAGFRVRRIDTAGRDWLERLEDVAFVFNVLHGPGGEDGTVQGTLETLHLPYSGSGVLGSALAMDKRRSKQLWLGQGLPTAPFEELGEDSDWDGVIDRLGRVFVKPVGEGSSIGMAPAATPAELAEAYLGARAHGSGVIAERFIDGPEYTVAILGDEALPSIRLQAARGFYDYHAKYIADDTSYHVPSGLDAGDEAALGQLALAAFAGLDCRGWGRVDVMRDPVHGFQLLEANTIPGMTDHSLVPMAAQAAGLTLAELVTGIIVESLRAWGTR
ncbi:D-alanine--D-alanine ligase [Pseudohaliea rubra]|uniref:D-alanine--D-alanine ligase n=1 Tax=Pseudohaliea rubra DSM 19751 TaxID=1265313 RepID=A0A095XU98_9GAMM|nr:D-alanine--D-alanine ligase [Pseudohaliea rubra]KGE03261.1 D-alanine--D-alanine ligase [Pseudohaliea rubra DSM 19751]